VWCERSIDDRPLRPGPPLQDRWGFPRAYSFPCTSLAEKVEARPASRLIEKESWLTTGFYLPPQPKVPLPERPRYPL
jgi:hypothetical protein